MSDTPEALATPAGVQAYLEDTAFASRTVDLLKGGYSAFTYRIHLRTPIDRRSTFVLKYTPSYAAASIGERHTDAAFCGTSGAEQKFEAEAFRLSRQLSIRSGEITVEVPALRLYDEEKHVMIVDDAGTDARTLKEILINESLPTALLQEMGTALGYFLSHLHGLSECHDVDLSLFTNNEVGKMITAWMTYSRTVSTLTGKDEIPALSNPPLEISGEKLAAFSKLVEIRSREIHSSTGSDVMTHGDFWPGNIMVCLRRGANGTVEAVEKLYVVDWEVAKMGLPGLDLGQLCAELYLISRFYPRRKESAEAVITSFLSTYRRCNNKVDPALAGVTVGHIGAHLVTLGPRISWGGREQTRKVVQEGVEMLTLGCTGSVSSLQESIVGPLLSE
ncbi:kinase-like domain-containing protein [Pisolithus orientalis]|uniref:kinase-like domain-containing protein n=1 Tax=Pisolithus orientalis TaxID=936130 RepID=UPI0022249D05|nr:kinase-like domain-containing protein [Pisolithus orientalis]KAI6008387.1 kinase-like domain-containing protein [Pisolithus orientalis]